MEYVKFTAKALLAALAAGTAVVVGAGVELPLWFTVASAAVVAGLAVFGVSNGADPRVSPPADETEVGDAGIDWSL